MICITTRVTKTKVLLLILIILIPICFYFAVSADKQSKPQYNVNGATTVDRIDFLEQFGWQCDENSETEKSTVIPAVFDEVYAPYNEIQKAQHFNLEDYKGKTVTLFNIKITNYPENSEYVYASLLVYEGNIIGGDVHSTALNGFMHGFDLTDTGLDFGQHITTKQ